MVLNGGSLDYETVAAGQTAQVLGGDSSAKVGDHLESVTIIPAAANCGVVQIKDGSGTAITIFAGGGTTALQDLRPQTVKLGIKSRVGAWQLTTGANVSAIVAGYFS